ncbi:GTPase domain-containing protein [Legionella fallonii]|uniref:Uncharacterized protein n=1 Tax=Legionella fallonii LLAP-10 TaxID=1212491 RepID=A0A098G2C0_9GAMM|nr:GTPase domain-containing protein [Legionella fallonii]CEG56623.1 conserved protein of unknown function [miro-like] [Legionella fallonii LLAP-10]
MWSKLFKQNNSAKNILVLGETGCGKRSFILHYKDGIIPNGTELPEFHSLTYKKKLNKEGEQISLIFTLNRTGERMIPSMSKEVKYDLILILSDLSSENAKKDLDFYKDYAKIHFPDVKTIPIGTKQDQKLESNVFDGLINTSAKTNSGFDAFEEQLLESLHVTAHKKGLDLK